MTDHAQAPVGAPQQMLYAAVSNSTIVNVFITTSDPKDGSIRIDNLNPEPSIGWTTPDNGQTWVAPPVPPDAPLNKQYTPQKYGMFLINQFQSNSISLGLTSDQRLQLDQTLLPYAVMLQSGDLQGFLNEVPNIPVDGVIITSSMITNITMAVTAYLSGS